MTKNLKKLLWALFIALSYVPMVQAQLAPVFQFPAEKYLQVSFAGILREKYCFVLTKHQGSISKSQIWSSDGTAQGTYPISDTLTEGNNFVLIKDNLFFTSYDTQTDWHNLWKTDGTRSGTVSVAPINKKSFRTESGGTIYISGGYYPDGFTTAENILYFVGNGGQEGIRQLWRSDGTNEGTFSIKDNFDNQQFSALSDGNGMVYFLHQSATFPEQTGLWKSDGTKEGTVLVKRSAKKTFDNIHIGNGIFSDGIGYFAAVDSLHGNELWRTDGTEAGTYLLRDVNSKVASGSDFYPFSANPANFFAFRKQVYFTAQHYFYPYFTDSLWRTDGTSEGTVAAIPVSVTNFFWTRDFWVHNDQVFFAADDSISGKELWVWNGSDPQPHLIKDIWKGRTSSLGTDRGYFSYSSFASIKNYCYFLANDGVHGRELWRTDGTEIGTELVADMAAGATWTFSYSSVKPFAIGDVLFLMTQDKNSQWQVYTYRHQPQIPVVPPTHSWPDQEWFQTIGADVSLSSNRYVTNVYGLTNDQKGNIYVSGTYQSPYGKLIFYDNDAQVAHNPKLRPYGDFDNSYFSKFSPQGKLLWNKSICGGQYYSTLATDLENNIYVAGKTRHKAVFDSLEVALPGNEMFYIAKYNAAGKPQWVKTGTLNFGGNISSVKVDGRNNVYVAGNYSYSLNLGDGTVLTTKMGSAPFIAKFAPNGKIVWANNIDTRADTLATVIDLKIGKNHEPYLLLAGRQSKGKLYSVVNLKPSGETAWIQSFQGDSFYLNSFDVSSLNEMLIAGSLSTTFHSGRYTLQPNKDKDSRNVSTAFFIKLQTTNGKIVNIAPSTQPEAMVTQVSFNPDNSYFLVGTQNYKAIDQQAGYEGDHYPSGAYRLFIRKYDFLGHLLSQRELYKSNSITGGSPKITVDANGYIVVGDTYQGLVDTIPNSLDNPNINVGLMRFKNESTNFEGFEIPHQDSYTVSPNPSSGYVVVRANVGQARQYDLRIVNSLGQLVYKHHKTDEEEYLPLDLSLAPGLYLVTIEGKDGRVTKRIVKH